MIDKLLSPEEAGEILGIGADATRRLCSDGHLTYVRLGQDRQRGRIRIRPRDLEAFIDSRLVPAADRTNPVLAQLKQGRRPRAS